MDNDKQFSDEVNARIDANGRNEELKSASLAFMRASVKPQYSYNFSWLGRPIIQYPQDMIAMQEIVWDVQPELIIETGVARGGSLVFFASLLELVSQCTGSEGKVLGIDIDIRPHNRTAIERHPMSRRIGMIKGSSIAAEVISQVRAEAQGKRRVLVCLDSNHTADHVQAELDAYARLVSVGSYCVVFDTFIEEMPAGAYPDRAWDIGNNPATAVREFLASNRNFEIDRRIENKLLVTVASGGYLKRLA